MSNNESCTKEAGSSASKPLVYIDCAVTIRSPVNTGIQRVVRSILREVVHQNQTHNPCVQRVALEGYGIRLLPTFSKIKRVPHLLKWLKYGGRLISGVMGSKIYLFIRKRLINPINLMVSHLSGESDSLLPIRAGIPSILILLDSNWDNKIWRTIDQFRSNGGKVCAVLYDLIPFSHPETVERNTRLAHTSWWRKAPKKVDAVICISKSVRDEFLKWQCREFGYSPISENNIGYFYLGANFSRIDPVIRVISEKIPFFLMVGSIEPRKNQALVLDSFEMLWGEGSPFRLVLVGAHGWKNERLLERITNHPQLNNKLFLVRDASDRDLAALYQAAQGLIIASEAEGFGLPIIEAQQFGTRVISSDIPIFREVVNALNVANNYFFEPSNREALKKVLSSLPVVLNENQKKSISNVSWISWKESASEMINTVEKLVTSRKC